MVHACSTAATDTLFELRTLWLAPATCGWRADHHIVLSTDHHCGVPLSIATFQKKKKSQDNGDAGEGKKKRAVEAEEEPAAEEGAEKPKKKKVGGGGGRWRGVYWAWQQGRAWLWRASVVPLRQAEGRCAEGAALQAGGRDWDSTQSLRLCPREAPSPLRGRAAPPWDASRLRSFIPYVRAS